MEILNLFPTNVFIKTCDLDLNKLEQDCYNFSKQTVSNSRSGTGFQYHEFYCDELISEIKESIPQREDCLLKKLEANFWVNINQKNDYNAIHHHGPFSGNALSGVFYVKTPENCGNIRIYDPRNVLTDAPDLKYYNFGNDYHWFKPKPNLLLIFPSWLHHLVEPNLSEEDRISISFNIQIDY
jgi:uncharacterized protein (TIGR02466 family)